MRQEEAIYRTEDITIDMDAGEYIRMFRDSGKVWRACEHCPNYGRSWACPPFLPDQARLPEGYKRVLLIVSKIIPDERKSARFTSRELIACERERVERRLLEMERECDGRALTAVGSCTDCDGSECARMRGLPCRHPERVRPSLEAYGFDVGRTVSELFGLPMLWSRGGRMPEYLLLVCGLFYNSGPAEFGDAAGRPTGDVAP